MTIADALALGRAIAVVPIVYAISVDAGMVAFALFVVAALSDAADGWIARRTAAPAHGALVDPIADKVLVLGTAGALVFAGLEAGVILPLELFALLAVRELTATVIRLDEFRRGLTRPADASGKAKTAAEMIALAMLIAVPPPAPLGVAALSLLWIAVLFGFVALAQHWPHRRRSAL